MTDEERRRRVFAHYARLDWFRPKWFAGYLELAKIERGPGNYTLSSIGQAKLDSLPQRGQG